MKRTLTVLIFVCAWIFSQAQTNIITTIAGNGTAGFCCDHGPATNAKLHFPNQLCIDRLGNIYISDAFNNRIRKLDVSTGTITTVAGDGTNGFFGDGGPASSSKLWIPDGIAMDTSENIYIADGINNRIRRIDKLTGVITTIAGNGIAGSSGDGGLAINAELNGPGCLSVDKMGNVYVADYFGNKIRKINTTTGIISAVAGNGTAGYSGDGGIATNAQLSKPGQAFVDTEGNIFFTDAEHSVVRKISSATGIITTIAGNGIAGYSGDGGPAANANLNQPFGLFIDAHNNIFIVEWGNGTIRKVESSTGIISTVVGCGIQGFSGDGGPATSAKLIPEGIIIDSKGTMFIADMDNNRIRMVYNPQLSAPNDKLTMPEVKIYPNPAYDELNVEYDFNEDATLQISEVTGRAMVLKNLDSKKNKESIDIRAVPQGIYFYRILQNGVIVYAGKVVKE